MRHPLHILPKVTAVIVVLFFVTACDNETEASREDIIRQAQTLRPADPALAKKYERSCAACHQDPMNQAPLSGDTRAWASRVKQRGLEGLLENTLNGYEGMPPLGACPDCSTEDFEALIFFMAHSGEKL